MTVDIVALEIHPVEPIDGVQKTVETSSEVGDVVKPTEADWGVHVANAKSKDGEQNGYYGSSKHRNLILLKKKKLITI